MSRWFRFYADAIRNPKVARLTDAQFRLWVELLAVAADNDGLIPALDDLKHVLKRRLDHLSRAVEDLINASLIDQLTIGYEPHNWSKFQYKSDTSTDRVAKFRGKRNVSPTVSETPPDTEADTEQSSVSKETAVEPEVVDPDKAFWDSAKAYLGGSKSSLIGKWASEYGRPAVVSAILTSQLERPIDKVEFISGVLRRGQRANQPVIPM